MLAALDECRVWLNSEPLTTAELRGHVVAVEFWTYSCVNWLRTLPYVRAWAERYAIAGSWCSAPMRQSSASSTTSVTCAAPPGNSASPYPVVIDNEFAIWRAFGNHYWPALYVVDGEGRVAVPALRRGVPIRRWRRRSRGCSAWMSRSCAWMPAVSSQAADWGALRFAGDLCRVRARGAPGRGPGGLALNQWALGGRWAVEGGIRPARGPPAARSPTASKRGTSTSCCRGTARGALHGAPRRRAARRGPRARRRRVRRGDASTEPRMYQLVRQRAAASGRSR